MSDEICRVVKRELISGTYYIAQRKVWKTRLFSESGYEWEDFTLKKSLHYGTYMFEKLHYCDTYDPPPKELKDKSYAEAACSEWVRVNNGDEVVTVWSKGD